MKMLFLFPILLATWQCSSATSHSYCGDSFCIEAQKPIIARKSTPVEDFNLYNVKVEDLTYQIYEGDNPQFHGKSVRRLHADGRETLEMLRGNGSIALKFDRGEPKNVVLTADERMPRYLMIWTRCPAKEECSIIEFWNLIRPFKKPSH